MACSVPTTAISAPLLEETSIDINGKNTEVYIALSRLTTVFDITGLPSLNVPAGLVNGILPVGVQLVGREFDEGSSSQSRKRVREVFKNF